MAIGGLTALAVAAGSAGAIAASGDGAKKTEDAILSDAAKRLKVDPSDLRSALRAAEDAQLDQAVKDGKLTQAQADAIKKRAAESGRVLGLGPGGPGGPRGHGGRHGHGGPGGPGGPGFGRGAAGGLLADAAGALDLTPAQLRTRLEAGKTLAEIAKAQNKDLAAVKSALKAALTKRLDAAVKAGTITGAMRDHELAEFDDHFDGFATGRRPDGPRSRKRTP
jgi:hypothetical protein